MLGLDLTFDLVVMRIIAGVIISAVQGGVLASVAVLLGDRGPRYDGRMTVVPWPHVDLVGLLSMVLTGFGWGRQVAIDANLLRPGRLGLVIAVLTSSLALLLLAVLLLQLVIPLLSSLDYTAGVAVVAFLREAAQMAVWIALFSLLPAPPLPGAHFLAALSITVPPKLASYLGWALLVLSLVGVTRLIVAPAYELVAPLVLGADAAR